MFSVMCVCLFRGRHVAITHNVLDLIVQGPPTNIGRHWKGLLDPLSQYMVPYPPLTMTSSRETLTDGTIG